jgi:acetyl-CoA acyltransferase
MAKQVQDAYIVAATRTPVGKAPKGMFKNIRPDDLLAHSIRSALSQVPSLDPATVEDVIVGCAIPEAEQGLNVARIGLLLAGLPNNVPGMTINRFCSSGLQAVALAADRVRLGDADVMIGAGTESMSLIPMGGHKVATNPRVFEGNENVAIAYGMGITAERVAKRWNVSREAQDEFASGSHEKALKAIAAGDFKNEITPYEVKESCADLDSNEIRVRSRTADTDEGPRAGSTPEVLAKLKPAFAQNGSVTAGNSSQMSDGAAAVVLVSGAAAARYNLKPIARFLGYSVAGVPPEIMGIGPIKAIPKALERSGVAQDDLGWIELNEAFAAQALAVIGELGLDQSKVNPLGGAIALGHPLGATGAIRIATLVHGLQRRKQKYGMVTMCIGTGMGAAGVFEAVT